ncbi:Zn-dependent hydrolase [Rhizobium sp. YIM 134829]|uniref:Zn-dependent hydrolase n=1 Tax=Rhizobium sp. YIM 134829 TaxID=3390453 RepID=UPI00397C5EDB
MALPAISPDRLWTRLMALGEHGALPGGGVNRQALSREEISAWRQLISWGSEVGLEASTDPAGNLFLSLEGQDPNLAPVLIGSHIDSQPTGGLFDGAFGVLAALEAVTALAEAGVRPQRSIVVVGWMNEEGSRFAPGMMGSELFAGRRTLEEVTVVRDADGISVGEALAGLHAAFPALPRCPLGFPIHAYIEPHIEQADLLEKENAVIGVVSGIQGKKTYDITIHGREAHAGTEPMSRRRDAVRAFSRMATRMHDAMDGQDFIKFTIGRVVVEPNAPSVVPARVSFRIDLRHPDNAVLKSCGCRLEDIALAEAGACELEIRRLVDAPSNGFDAELGHAIRRSADRHGFPHRDILSAAGHDARQMALLARSAMIFIPCRGGISHHPDEWSEPDHVAAGATVLLDLLCEEAGLPLNQGDA